uniref:Uncharacterized protein n=1 Tax=Ditylum brightwellii TaxID=49249 RepID=A0A7S4V638_9STRA
MTTFISRNDGKEMLVFTEWPDGHVVCGMARSSSGKEGNDVTKTTFEYDVYAKRSTLPFYKYNLLLPKLQLKKKHGENEEEEEVIVSPPRSQFIQFGKDKTSSSKYSGGARETYSYTFTPPPLLGLEESSSTTRKKASMSSFLPSFFKKQITDNDNNNKKESKQNECQVRYTRYGESPPWYGIQRMCTLELVGTKQPHISQSTNVEETMKKVIPPTLFNLVQRTTPLFLNILQDRQGKEEEAFIHSTIASFQKKKLQIEPTVEEEEQQTLSNKMEEWMDSGWNVGKRIKRATSFSSV